MVIGLHQMQTERLMAAPKPDERLVILAAILSLADQNVKGYNRNKYSLLQTDGGPLKLNAI